MSEELKPCACHVELLRLAERVEGATGADRELDRDIAVLVYGLTPDPDYDPGAMWRNAFGRRINFWPCSHAGPENVEAGDMGHMTGWTVFDFPPFTASLDAAVSLVPEGWSVTLSWPGEFQGVPWAHLKSVERNPFGMGEAISGRAATPALALTAACLKARAATLGDDHE